MVQRGWMGGEVADLAIEGDRPTHRLGSRGRIEEDPIEEVHATEHGSHVPIGGHSLLPHLALRRRNHLTLADHIGRQRAHGGAASRYNDGVVRLALE
jgi:hypothetical protein